MMQIGANRSKPSETWAMEGENEVEGEGEGGGEGGCGG